jgi:dephospho-CoA kinase
VLEIGLTGGIGSGKSTVAAGLVDRGAVLIDADAIVRDMQAPGAPVFDAIVQHFGAGVVRDDGTLDRAAIAAIVFADSDALSALNAMVHPAVGAEIARQREAVAATDAVVIFDIPLLIDANGERKSHYDHLAAVIVVDVEPEIAVARLVEHRGFDVDDARARIANQASREARVAHADFVIDNSGDLAALESQLDACWTWLTLLVEQTHG